MILSCLPGASLSKAILCSERHFKGQSVLRAANRGAHPRGLLKAILCYERVVKGNPVLRAAF